MTRSIDETKELFDRWAESYDHDIKNTNGILEGYETSLETAAKVCKVTNGLRVLDIGIGTGGFAQLFEQQGARISGIDLSERMIDECKRRHPAYDLRLGTFQRVPYSNETFDAVISSFCFHEVPIHERRAACNEVYRARRGNSDV
ncbi:MAG: methyltransferase domain-containing protein [Alicyclobacillus sp.]|nr:methyltransferase domain-containing protein [Alicyclobacillus sp.]